MAMDWDKMLIITFMMGYIQQNVTYIRSVCPLYQAYLN